MLKLKGKKILTILRCKHFSNPDQCFIFFQIVENSLTTACKCHGVSGSCSIKTCWRALPDFSKIGAKLKERYGMAIEVKRKRRKNVYMFKPINKKLDIIPADELVYIQKSPDYCSPDKKMGSIGTKGR